MLTAKVTAKPWLLVGFVLGTFGGASSVYAAPITLDCALIESRENPPPRSSDPAHVFAEYKERLPGVRVSPDGSRFSAFNQAGETVGYIEYHLGENRRLLEISHSWTSPAMRGKGVNTMLFARVLSQYPSIQRIATTLAEENLAIFKSAIKLGAKPLEALQATPAYKTRKTLGFGRVLRDESYITSEAAALVVQRGD